MPTKRTVISIAPKALLDTPENAPAIAVAAADNAVPTTPTTTMTTTAAPAAPTPKPSATTSLKNPRTPPATSKRAEEMAPPPAKRRRTVAASAAAAGTAPPASRPGRVTMTTAASSKTAGQATDVADDNNAKPAEGAMTGPPPPPSKRGGAAAAGRGSAASAARKTPAAATAATRKQTSVTNAKAIALTSRRAAKPQPPLPIHLQMQMEANAIAAKGGAAANHGAAASKTTKPISATSSATNTTNSTTAKPTPYPAGRTHFTGAKGSAPLKTLSSVATMVPKSAPRPTSTTPYAAAPTTLKTLQRPNGNAMKPMRPISSTTTPSTTKLNDSQTSIIAGVNAANTAPESNPFLAQDPSLPHSTIDEIINEANDLLQAASEAQSLGRLRMSASYLLLAHARLVGLGRRFDRSRCVEMGGNGAAVGAGAGAGAGFGGAMSKGIPSSVGSGANGGANAHVNSNAPSFPPPMEIHSSNSNQGPPSTLSAPSAGPPPQTQPQTPQETAPTAKSAPRNPQKPLSQQSHIQQPDPQQPQSQRPLHRHPPPHPSNPHPQHPRPPPSHLQRPYPYPHPQHPHPPQPVHTLPPLVQTANLPLPNLEHDAAMMEQLARTAMELHHKRTGRGMQHEALLEKQKLLKMAKSKDGSDGGNEAVAGVEENTDVRLGGEEESAEGNKGKGRGKGKGKGKGKTKAESGAERGSSPMKRKGGRGKKPPTLVMHTLPCARLDAKKIMQGYG